MKKVTVLVAVYNQQEYIGRCLRSLLHQSMSKSLYDVIVIDDGSNDLTKYALTQFCDPFDSNIKVLTNKQNQGLPTALNRGISASNSEYIVRVDSDDFVNEYFLSFLAIYLDTNNESSAVACDYLLIDDSEAVIKRVSCEEEPIACGVMFRAKDLRAVGMYDESFNMHEETDLRIRYKKRFNITRLGVPLYRYRKHDSNMTNDQVKMESYKQKLLKKHGTIAKDID